MSVPKVFMKSMNLTTLKSWGVAKGTTMFYGITKHGHAVWGETHEDKPWTVKWQSKKPSCVKWIEEIIEFIHQPL